ncbi:hypothetical protein Hamer_G018737 [Homarus americanus]|uniref:Uncharacterized protein n=1 Tax=Homarus americanus TaxID=6706 RepID=A0A8J5JLD8_HOMAM|nr:hypothetical protein Hamer_G018737 [Homarus americanus]
MGHSVCFLCKRPSLKTLSGGAEKACGAVIEILIEFGSLRGLQKVLCNTKELTPEKCVTSEAKWHKFQPGLFKGRRLKSSSNQHTPKPSTSQAITPTDLYHLWEFRQEPPLCINNIPG